MRSVFSEKPCDNCNADRQIGNPYNWQRECDRCTKIGQWRNEVLKRLAEIENILGDEYDLDRLKELAEADKEGRCIILSEIKDGDSLPGTEVIATNNIKYSYGYGSYLIGYIVKDETSETGYSCENDFSILLNVTHWGKLPKITKGEEE